MCRSLLKRHHVGVTHAGRRFLALIGPANKHLSTGNRAVRNDPLDYPGLFALVGDATAGLRVNERSTCLLEFFLHRHRVKIAGEAVALSAPSHYQIPHVAALSVSNAGQQTERQYRSELSTTKPNQLSQVCCLTNRAIDHTYRHIRYRASLRRRGRGQASRSDRRRRPGPDAGHTGVSTIGRRGQRPWQRRLSELNTQRLG
jgi:hypothetical protein